MATTTEPSTTVDKRVLQVLQHYWGYDQLRPLQQDAIQAGLDGADSLVVMPTGGGKSLCYQIPPLVAERTDVVVSPLIALMKDQVDTLKANGVPAAALFSGITEAERRDIEARAAAGQYRVLFVAPERLVTPNFINLCKRMNVRAFAIDEAHCISHWGHDFRPEYRRLTALRDQFPNAAIHAFTATATERVRQDIAQQLRLHKPRVMVGTFDRPNLVYRIVLRHNADAQLLEVVRRHKDEAVIVYCISRGDTEKTAAMLVANGVKAAAYHAGLAPNLRAKTQEDFAAERLDVVVATVAFGMGIDRSNVRCVVHTALPKSVEQYQQETGRAGRDGLEAECVLLYSPADAKRWESLMQRSAREADEPVDITAQLELLADMQRFASSQVCRHKALSRYFGQDYPADNCGACDACLTPPDQLESADELAQQVLSCIRALRVPFGVTYVVEVLTGAKSARIQQMHHDQLPQFGALKGHGKELVRDVVFQLVDQGYLERTGGDRPVLVLQPAANALLTGETHASLVAPKTLAAAKTAAQDAGWEGVDRGLFEELRTVRRDVATEQGVPAFVVLGDASLRELARVRPTLPDTFRRIKGIGEQKLADLGRRFTAAIADYCADHGLTTDVAAAAPAPAPTLVHAPKVATPARGEKLKAYELFDEGHSVKEVVQATGRAPSTVEGYLEDWISERKPASVAAWVDDVTYQRVKRAAVQCGEGSLLKPIWEALRGEVGYDQIRVVLRHTGMR